MDEKYLISRKIVVFENQNMEDKTVLPLKNYRLAVFEVQKFDFLQVSALLKLQTCPA